MSKVKLKSKHKIKKINKVVIISILVFFNSVFILTIFNKITKPILLDYAKNKIEIETKSLIVKTINEELNNNIEDYESIYKTVSNSDKEILLLDYDTIKINKILNNITLCLIDNLKSIEDSTFLNNNEIYYIPFGAITNLGTSNWIGPQIPIKVMTSGNIESKIITDLKEYGINNLVLEMYIDINVDTNILLPYTSGYINVNYKVPIIKKVIEGKIPSVYGGMYSTSSNIINDLIE